jgi:hypothetical protein
MKFLKKHPVRDHMLDVVRHHSEHGGDEKPPEMVMLERRESDFSTDAGRTGRSYGWAA